MTVGELDCPEALRHLQEYIDGEMSDAKLAEISAHLAACYPCGDRVDFERHLRAVIRRNAVDRAPEGLLTKVRARCFGEVGSDGG